MSFRPSPVKRIAVIFFSIISAGKFLNSAEVKDPRMVSQLMGEGKTESVLKRKWSGDLGVMFFHNQKVHLLTGDTLGLGIFAPNAIASSSDLNASDGIDLKWSTKPDGTPKPFFPRIDPDSTVPAGAISLRGVIYVFMMDVTHWKDLADLDTRARAVLIKSMDNAGSFSLVWIGPEDGKFVNIAPVVGPHPADATKQAVYLFGSGKYRNSPVYLAAVDIENIESQAQYLYYKGVQNGVPQWSYLESNAVPVVSGVKVGELSVAWNDYLDKWLLSYFDFSAQPVSLHFRVAAKPWGSWSSPKIVFGGGKKYPWYADDKWGGPYGGYLLRELDGNGGRNDRPGFRAIEKSDLFFRRSGIRFILRLRPGLCGE